MFTLLGIATRKRNCCVKVTLSYKFKHLISIDCKQGKKLLNLNAIQVTFSSYRSIEISPILPRSKTYNKYMFHSKQSAFLYTCLSLEFFHLYAKLSRARIYT